MTFSICMTLSQIWSPEMPKLARYTPNVVVSLIAYRHFTDVHIRLSSHFSLLFQISRDTSRSPKLQNTRSYYINILLKLLPRSFRMIASRTRCDNDTVPSLDFSDAPPDSVLIRWRDFSGAFEPAVNDEALSFIPSS